MLFKHRLQARVLRFSIANEDTEAILGDLAAEGERMKARGVRRAWIAMWQWQQVLIASVHGAVAAVRRMGRPRLSLSGDIRQALRSLRRRPASAIAMVLTLALGIGVNAAGFTVLDALLLKPLPFPDADRLVVLKEIKTTDPAASGGVSFLNFSDWRASAHAFESMALVTPDEGSLSLAGTTVPIRGLHVSPGFFRTLGVGPALGTTFDGLGDEAMTETGAWPLMLSDRGWRRHFASAPDVIGKVVQLDGHLAQIVGVTGPGVFPLVEEPIDYWATTISHGRSADPSSANGSRNFRQYPGVLARLKPGVTIEAALADLRQVEASLASRFPNAFKGRDVRIDPVREVFAAPATPVVWLLYGLVTVIWLVACVNVTNMSLARAASRKREVSVRLAIGASRWTIIRQFIVESFVVALAGAVTGLAAAAWLLAALIPHLPSDVPPISSLTPDVRVLVMTVGLAALTALICGGLPGWLSVRSARSRLGLNERQSTASVPRSLRDSLIAVQVTMALVLLSAAGLLTNSLLRLQREAPGFDLTNVWTTRLALSDPQLPDLSARQIEQQLNDIKAAVIRTGGVTGVAFSQSVPFTGFDNSTQVTVEGIASADSAASTQLRFVTPEYFPLMGIPAEAGRSLSADDNASRPAVVVVNGAFVRAFIPDGRAVGRRISVGWGGDGPKTIIGVVGDVRHRNPGDAPRPEVYVPQAQFGNTSLSLILRTAPGVKPSSDAIHRAIESVRPNMPRREVRALSEFRADTLSTPRFGAIVLGGFAGLALMLAAVGLYGITVYLTEQRTQEIGVRMALGAVSASVVWLVMRQALRPMVAGVPLGVLSAWVTAGLLQQWLYGVTPSDPLTMVVVVALLMLVAGAACAWPARSAARVDPITALRAD